MKRAEPRRAGHARRGSALVELALALPMLLALLIGMLEFGMVGLRHLALTGAVRAGVDYAFQYDDVAGTQRAVQTAAGSEAVSVTSTRFCECAGASVVCGGLCPGNVAQQIFVTVSARETYAPMFVNHHMIASLLGSSATLAASATFRIQ